jgi:hypothetical protein
MRQQRRALPGGTRALPWMTEKPSGGCVEGGSKKNRKILIQLLPLIAVIINIFLLLKLPSSHTTFP